MTKQLKRKEKSCCATLERIGNFVRNTDLTSDKVIDFEANFMNLIELLPKYEAIYDKLLDKVSNEEEEGQCFEKFGEFEVNYYRVKAILNEKLKRFKTETNVEIGDNKGVTRRESSAVLPINNEECGSKSIVAPNVPAPVTNTANLQGKEVEISLSKNQVPFILPTSTAQKSLFNIPEDDLNFTPYEKIWEFYNKILKAIEFKDVKNAWQIIGDSELSQSDKTDFNILMSIKLQDHAHRIHMETIENNKKLTTLLNILENGKIDQLTNKPQIPTVPQAPNFFLTSFPTLVKPQIQSSILFPSEPQISAPPTDETAAEKKTRIKVAFKCALRRNKNFLSVRRKMESNTSSVKSPHPICLERSTSGDNSTKGRRMVEGKSIKGPKVDSTTISVHRDSANWAQQDKINKLIDYLADPALYNNQYTSSSLLIGLSELKEANDEFLTTIREIRSVHSKIIWFEENELPSMDQFSARLWKKLRRKTKEKTFELYNF